MMKQVKVVLFFVEGSEASVTNHHPEMLLQECSTLMEEILEKKNLKIAYETVVKNKGCAGIDDMKVAQFKDYLKSNWRMIREQLLNATYRPRAVKRLEIPKKCGGKRMLGIPTVLDRFIQQAILQVLQHYIDPSFSDNSYGFRPKRSAIMAIEKSKEYVVSGYEVVVDIDLEKFFDRVNHDKLMSELFKRIKDSRVLKLIRSYLDGGAMEQGMFVVTVEGTPQGGPLSPFLSNIMLDLLDKELESRGLKHVRYADDCNIYVGSLKAGERVMKSVSDFIEGKLKLKVNKDKSKVDKVDKRKFLGFRLLSKVVQSVKEIKIVLSPESLVRIKDRVRELTSKCRGISTSEMLKQLSRYLNGWIGYYGRIETGNVLKDLDGWIRRKVRCYQLKQWKTSTGRYNGLTEMKVSSSIAYLTSHSSRGLWHLSRCMAIQIAMSEEKLKKMGLRTLFKVWKSKCS